MPLPEPVTEMAASVRNWGRWGADDERGTLNLLTPTAVRRGVDAVRDGRAFSLALTMTPGRGLQPPSMPLRPDPIRTMTVVNAPVSGDAGGALTSDDVVVMGLQASTHWDALAHFTYGGSLYNGHPAGSIGAGGAARCGIGVVGTLVSRGVLLDVARALGVDRLEPGYPISVADLDAAESQAGVTVEPGDVVLVRTGFVQLVLGRRVDRQGYGGGPSPGLTVATARWFHARDVAAVAVDNYSLEVYPWEYEDGATAVHVLHLVEMGMLQGQNWVLEDLAADCAADGRYSFLLDATPLPFAGATGAPVHPVALK